MAAMQAVERTARIARVVSRSWIGPIERDRDRTSPNWRFSNQERQLDESAEHVTDPLQDQVRGVSRTAVFGQQNFVDHELVQLGDSQAGHFA